MKRIILITILYFGITNLFAQKAEVSKQGYPINISIAHETISLPLITNPIKYSFNPTILIGTEYILKEKNNHDLHLSGNLGYYYHKDWESTIFTEIKFGYRHYINRFLISSNIGIGYAHIFTPKPIYQFDNEKFVAINDKGRSAFQSSFSIIPSYKLFKKVNSDEMFFTYTFTIQYPFNETKGFHQFIGLGYKFYPFKN